MSKQKKGNDLTKNNYDFDDVIEIFVKRFQNTPISNEEFNVVTKYYRQQAPSKIYRYRPEKLKEIKALVENKIWFSTLAQLNDPFEYNFKFDVMKILASRKDIQNQMLSMSFVQKQVMLKKLSKSVDYESFYRDVLSNYTISCFSEVHDSLLIWGHYSSGHRGICVEYDTVKLGSEYGKVVMPVNYQEKLPLMSAIDEASIARSFFFQIARTKATDWSYEREWRCIQDKGACGEEWSLKGALLDSSPPTAIYLGCNAEGEFADSLIRTCKEKLRIPVYKMKKSEDDYKLIPIRIT